MPAVSFFFDLRQSSPGEHAASNIHAATTPPATPGNGASHDWKVQNSPKGMMSPMEALPLLRASRRLPPCSTTSRRTPKLWLQTTCTVAPRRLFRQVRARSAGLRFEFVDASDPNKVAEAVVHGHGVDLGGNPQPTRCSRWWTSRPSPQSGKSIGY